MTQRVKKRKKIKLYRERMLERKKVRELMLLLGTTMLTVENPK